MTLKQNERIVVPPNLTTMAAYIFGATSKTYPKEIIFPEGFSVTKLSDRMLQNLIFDSDFRVPSCVTELGMGFNYGGCFKNVTIPATCTKLNSSCFGSSANDAANNYTRFKTLTFESEIPPSVGSNAIAKQHINNGLKIYVPDNSVEEYKATTNLTTCADNIYPISQKE